MTDKSNFDSRQKRSPLQGISLADFGGNLNFGPTLVPASESASISRHQPIATPTSSRGDLDQHGELDSFLGQQASSQQQAHSPYQTNTREPFEVVQEKSQNSPFFTMSSSLPAAHEDFLSAVPTNQGQPSSFGPQIPTTKSPITRPSAGTPQTTSGLQTSPQLPNNLPKSHPASSSSLPQVPQPATSWPQTPPRPASGWSQTPPKPAASWSQAPSQPSTSLSQTSLTSSSSSPSSESSSTSLQATPQHNLPTSHQMQSETPVITQVEPVHPHWFYRKGNSLWLPFSFIDSECLEQALKTASTSGDRIVPTDGGRYDVNLDKRLRYPLYWEETVSVVRRCTWFYKGDGDSKLMPYMEDIAARLEAEFLLASRENKWPRRVEMSSDEYVMMHNANVMVQFTPNNESENWSGEDIGARPKVVRRGIADIEDEIDDGEPAQVDHLIFVVHGIGPIADLNFRNIIECVDDFRKISLQMLIDHQEELSRGRAIGRVEFLPVQWHSKLHNDSTGVDERLQSISLGSIRRLREFTNSTLVDILFYTSPTYCKNIVDTVGEEIKRLLEIFQKRNPMFSGKCSVCGHSLGSSILFDILQHQQVRRNPVAKHSNLDYVSEVLGEDATDNAPSHSNETAPESDKESDDEKDEGYPALGDALAQLGLPEYVDLFESEEMDMETFLLCGEEDMKEMGIPMGPRKKLIGYLRNQKQEMEKRKLEREERKKKRKEEMAKAKAERQKEQNTAKEEPKSPGAEAAGSSMIPVKLDSVIARSSSSLPSVEVLYEQGVAGTGQPYVDYPQLDLQFYALFALGSPIGMFLTVRGATEIGLDYQLPTCPRLFNIFHPYDPVAYRIEPLVNPSLSVGPVLMPHHKGRKRLHLELRENLSKLGKNLKQSLIDSALKTWQSIHEFARAHSTQTPNEQGAAIEEATEVKESYLDPPPEPCKVGRLNGGQRIDYVLQEKPIESLNEYLFALGSHVTYWVSEDTALFILKQIYKG
ncbi:phospholipase DDHD2-like [Montipora foliosa]|uniref:phospholipase DDHD2-like n=1 Tax=Montipora foliosa TaxID=591990 RepID=UPI0035F13482